MPDFCLPTEARAKSVWRRRVVAGRDGRFDPAPQKAAGFESDTLESAKDLRGTEIDQSPKFPVAFAEMGATLVNSE